MTEGEGMRQLYIFDGLAGSDGPPLAQLRALAARPENTRFFRVAAEAVQASFDHVGAQVYRRELPGGLPLRELLTGPPAPPAVLGHSLVQGICAHVYQLCLLQPGPDAAPAPVAAAGHSMGVQAAIAAGRRLTDRRSFLRFSRASISLAAMIMLRCHQVFEERVASPAVTRAYQERAAAPAVRPTAMAAVLAIDEADLRARVAAYAGPVELAIVNSARSHVLAGTPGALAEFWLANADDFERRRVRWMFLASTAPFHSSLLAPAAELIHGDRGVLDYEVTGDGLALPVYVAEEPRNLQDRPDLWLDFVEQSFCRPVDWLTTVTTAVAATRPDQVVDFGPGPGARLFTRESLRHAGYSVPLKALAPR
ncbi:ACP S-malonyltransferase [Actinoplanes teichomyceticus]|uniref:Malonyl-CoA:ACP transacylase (MAT) domain-containing protein n=1 Tax=Actinoplanes teichomyceticus TaxID=1867 RepID=A0A561VGR2_ACTTI|nr:ACP S-malonyltransferase [Actinoplanes teichomyceticus]TWG10812.1 hypothetical protein FHX34_107309 [Actinoplanes teichomyceticus]GIF12567.1 hypothetical protein Ate01nite_25990 [Actinoplanes teichomyceticus]